MGNMAIAYPEDKRIRPFYGELRFYNDNIAIFKCHTCKWQTIDSKENYDNIESYDDESNTKCDIVVKYSLLFVFPAVEATIQLAAEAEG
jgi:hypothetical protein